MTTTAPRAVAADGRAGRAAAAAVAAPRCLVAVGHRAGRGRQPHHQPAAARPGPRRRRLRGGRPADARAVEPGLRLLPADGHRRRGDPGGLRGAVRRAGARPRTGDAARGDAAGLGGGRAARRRGDPRGRRRCGVRRAAAGHHAGLRGRRERAGQPAAAAPRRAGRALRGRGSRRGRAVVRPQLLEGVTRVRAARRLRGRRHTGLRGLRGVAMPVLEGALERSVELAAAMDARGFGRTADRGRAGAPGRVPAR